MRELIFALFYRKSRNDNGSFSNNENSFNSPKEKYVTKLPDIQKRNVSVKPHHPEMINNHDNKQTNKTLNPNPDSNKPLIFKINI